MLARKGLCKDSDDILINIQSVYLKHCHILSPGRSLKVTVSVYIACELKKKIMPRGAGCVLKEFGSVEERTP
jgi:hypothetical protein